jgi:hypothetical protein
VATKFSKSALHEKGFLLHIVPDVGHENEALHAIPAELDKLVTDIMANRSADLEVALRHAIDPLAQMYPHAPLYDLAHLLLTEGVHTAFEVLVDRTDVGADQLVQRLAELPAVKSFAKRSRIAIADYRRVLMRQAP